MTQLRDSARLAGLGLVGAGVLALVAALATPRTWRTWPTGGHPCVDLDIACHKQPGYLTRKRGCDRHLHLHGFDDSEQVACLDVIAWSYGKRDHDGRRRRSDNASFPVCHTVRDALDLHIIV